MLPPHVWQASSNDQHHFCVHTSSVVVVHIASSDLQKCCWPSGEFAAAFSRVAEGIPFEGTGCCPRSIDQVAGATWSSPRLASWVQVWRHSGEDLWTKRAFVEASSLVSIKIFRSSRLLCWLTLGQWGDCKGRESVGGNSNADTALTLCLRNVFFTSSHNAIHFFTAMTMYVEIVSSPTWVTLYCSTLVWPLLPGILFDVNLMVFAYWLCAPWSFESVIILILFNKAPWGLRTLMFSRFTSSSLPQSAQFFSLFIISLFQTWQMPWDMTEWTAIIQPLFVQGFIVWLFDMSVQRQWATNPVQFQLSQSHAVCCPSPIND